MKIKAGEQADKGSDAYRLKRGEGSNCITRTVYQKGGLFVYEQAGRPAAAGTLPDLVRAEPDLHVGYIRFA